MEYSKEFKALLNDSNWNQLEPYQKYIGVGNPNAKILIVGKECALDTVNQFFEYDELHNIVVTRKKPKRRTAKCIFILQEILTENWI